MREILGEVLGEVLERHVIVFITILGQPSGAGGILEYICCDAWLGIKALCFQALEISIEQALEGRYITHVPNVSKQCFATVSVWLFENSQGSNEIMQKKCLNKNKVI